MRSDVQRTDYHAEGGLSIPETICESMAHAADDLDLAAIAVFTETGTTARLLSKYHPAPPIFALSSIEAVIRRMVLLWGVHPVLCPKLQHTDQMVDTAEGLLLDAGHICAKQILGIVAGTRTKTGSTNFMRLHMVGDSDHTSRKSQEPKKAESTKQETGKKLIPLSRNASAATKKMLPEKASGCGKSARNGHS